jgi:OmpA family
VLAKALEFFRENSSKQLLIVGHTDASGSEEHNLQLSEDRALGVQALLLGNHEQWGELASRNHTTADLQCVLAWAATTEPLLGCHLGPVDDDLGPLTRDALDRFRKNAGALVGAPIGRGGSANAADFSAFAAVYDLAICRRLHCSREELDAMRSRIRMVAPGACGLGEAYARVHDKASDAERAHDRRVDILFFDASEARILESGDVASLLYGPNSFFRQVAIDVVPRLTADAIGILIVDDDECPLPNVRYRMTLPNGEVIEGTSDSEGMAYVSSIPSGTCRLELLDVDARDWDAPPIKERPLPPPLPDRVESEQREPIEEDIDWSVLDDDEVDEDDVNDVKPGDDGHDPQP